MGIVVQTQGIAPIHEIEVLIIIWNGECKAALDLFYFTHSEGIPVHVNVEVADGGLAADVNQPDGLSEDRRLWHLFRVVLECHREAHQLRAVVH